MDKTTEELAKSIGSRSFIKNPERPGFRVSGEAAAEIVKTYISRYISAVPGLDVLDFGCGSGRVVMPLAALLPEASFCATDVDAEAVEYIRRNATSNLKAELNPFNGPLPYRNGIFDVVYAVSVWSHFDEEKGLYWLDEIKRVLKPRGYAFLTVAGHYVVDLWSKQLPTWKGITAADLDRERFLYRDLANLRSEPEKYPGINENWGNTAIHPDYVREVWSKYFDVISVDPRGMNGNQDVAVLRKP